MIEAAGVLFLASDQVLLLKRSRVGDAQGTWALPGGKLEEGETAVQAAQRECAEEIGIHVEGGLKLFARRQASGVDYTTFLRRCAKTFQPRLNDEHEEYVWAGMGDFPVPLHPGVMVVLQKLSMDELGIAKAMAAGELTSPQHYENVTLFDLRITGTGTAFRQAHDEYVYRPPDQYLTPEFLARCNGLPVIMQHPVGSSLDSQEFADRIIGTILLPYIKGKEVWGIAKLYDDEAIKLMEERQLSTSPSVIFRRLDVNNKVALSSGSTLLIEGKPSLLDHLAVCDQGVWDKGGKPTGVSSITKHGAANMTEDEMKAQAEKDAKFEQTENDKAKKDAEGNQMDKLMSMCDSISKRLDSLEGVKAKKDADEELDEDGKPMPAVADKAKKDTMNQTEMADKAKKDGELAEAAAKENAKEKARKDADEKRDKDLEEIKAKLPKEVSDEDYEAMSDAQARADSVFSAFGKSAPRPLNGENVLGYRRRTASQLKQHSPAWSKIDLMKLGEEVLDVATPQIYADALVAAANPVDLPAGQLREIKRKDRTGREISTFVGSMDAWTGMFKAPKRRLAGINKGA